VQVHDRATVSVPWALWFMPIDKGWRAVIDTNLNGTWTMMQRAARHWRAAERPGSIVNIVAPLRGMYGLVHTVAARADVVQASRNVAIEWAPHAIRVNCILPGGIATRGLETYAPEVRERMREAHPLRTLGEVQDVAEAVAYLAAPSGRFITGEVLVAGRRASAPRRAVAGRASSGVGR
jgi:citronellol/citronellal dehydrogenase